MDATLIMHGWYGNIDCSLIKTCMQGWRASDGLIFNSAIKACMQTIFRQVNHVRFFETINLVNPRCSKK